jgi:hypothetical protein
MYVKELLIESRTIPETGQVIYGRVKFWVCPNKNSVHGKVKFRVGAQVIPPYKGS